MQCVREPQIIIKVTEAANGLLRQDSRSLRVAKRACCPARQVLTACYAPRVPNGFRGRNQVLANGNLALIVAELVRERTRAVNNFNPIRRARR
jgi:hypothetical protein